MPVMMDKPPSLFISSLPGYHALPIFPNVNCQTYLYSCGRHQRSTAWVGSTGDVGYTRSKFPFRFKGTSSLSTPSPFYSLLFPFYPRCYCISKTVLIFASLIISHTLCLWPGHYPTVPCFGLLYLTLFWLLLHHLQVYAISGHFSFYYALSSKEVIGIFCYTYPILMGWNFLITSTTRFDWWLPGKTGPLLSPSASYPFLPPPTT